MFKQLQTAAPSRNKYCERVAERLGRKGGAVKKLAQLIDAEEGQIETPYGTLIQRRVIDLAEKSLEVAYINPFAILWICLLYTSPSPRDISGSRMPSSA